MEALSKASETLLQNKLELLLQKKLSPTEFQEYRRSIYYLGRAIVRFVKKKYERNGN